MTHSSQKASRRQKTIPLFPEENRRDGAYIVKALQIHPELVLQFDMHLLTGQQWTDLLLVQPTLAPYCRWWFKLDGAEWATILQAQPQLSARCDAWERLRGDDWTNLLLAQPAFAKFCQWGKLSASNWLTLLLKWPHFLLHCLRGTPSILHGGIWAALLSEHPILAEHCDWERLSAKNWATLLISQPQFAERCDAWEQFTDEEWGPLITAQPQFGTNPCWQALANYPSTRGDYFISQWRRDSFAKCWRERLTRWPKLLPYYNGGKLRWDSAMELLAVALDISTETWAVCTAKDSNHVAIPENLSWLASLKMLSPNHIRYQDSMEPNEQLSPKDVPRFAIECTIGKVSDPSAVITAQILLGRWPFLLELARVDPDLIEAAFRTLLPLSCLLAPLGSLKVFLKQIKPEKLVDYRDKEGNTLLHYALARVMRANPVFVSLPAGADERQPFDLLRDHGLDPDIPNAGGFSCNHIIGIIENKLAAPREHNEFCEALLQNCGCSRR